MRPVEMKYSLFIFRILDLLKRYFRSKYFNMPYYFI